MALRDTHSNGLGMIQLIVILSFMNTFLSNNFFFDNNGYSILEGWCDHQIEPELQNSLVEAAAETHSLIIRPCGSGNVAIKLLITPL